MVRFGNWGDTRPLGCRYELIAEVNMQNITRWKLPIRIGKLRFGIGGVTFMWCYKHKPPHQRIIDAVDNMTEDERTQWLDVLKTLDMVVDL